jgi:hypothetical protein
MKYQIEVLVKAAGQGQPQLKFPDGAKVLMDITLDACIDGTAETGTMRMKMSMSGVAAMPQLKGTTIKLDVVGDGVETRRQTAAK